MSKTLASKDPARDSSVLPSNVKDPKIQREMETAFKGFNYQEDSKTLER